jgi:outer membrane protein OmpA-like peptidoglycan-associated protein
VSAPVAAPAITGNSTEDVYAAALRQSAATVTTAPANAGFAPPRGQAVTQFATTVPPIVQQNYNASLGVRPPVLPAAGTPTGGRFGAAGSRLLSTILFANGSATLSGQDRANLRSAVDEYKRSGGSFRIVGYASDANNRPSAQQRLANFDLSERRAASVANELIRMGARADAVFVEARSDAGVTGGSASDGRRAEIFLEN